CRACGGWLTGDPRGPSVLRRAGIGRECYGPTKGAGMQDLVCQQKVVEGMLGDGRRLSEVEDYIDGCALQDLDKAALWVLAWAHQEHCVQLRFANEMLALASSLSTPSAAAGPVTFLRRGH